LVDLIPFLVVTSAYIVIAVFCFKWIVVFILRKVGILAPARQTKRSRPRQIAKIAVISFGIIGLLMIGWSFIEPYYPVVETVRIQSSKIAAPVRIVQISDLHCDPTPRAEPKVVSIIESLKPDVIVFTGDGVNSYEGISLFKKTMRALSKVAPLLGVRGNWEAWWFKDVDTFKGTGLVELNGTARPVRVLGQTIWIGGIAVDEEDKMNSVLKKMPKDAFRLILHHFPAASTLVDGRADLLLSGDTHDGQIKLPLLGPLIRIKRWGEPFYHSGLHRTAAGLNYYVNRGIGMEGHHVPRVRFNCPPEITLIELGPKM
jgi:uncharacterized protein